MNRKLAYLLFEPPTTGGDLEKSERGRFEVYLAEEADAALRGIIERTRGDAFAMGSDIAELAERALGLRNKPEGQ
jgi:hypothetical protein